MKDYLHVSLKLWKLYKPFHKYIYLQIALIFIVQSLSIGVSVLNSKFLSNLVQHDTQAVLIIFLLWTSILILTNIFNYFVDINSDTRLGESVRQYLQEYSLAKILDLTVEQHIEDHSAIKQTIIVRGEGAVDRTVTALFLVILPAFLYLAISLITLSYYSILIGAISVLIMLVLFGWSYIFTNFHHPYVRKNRDNWVEQGKIRTEVFTHLALVKYFAKESSFIRKYISNRLTKVAHHLHTLRLGVNHRLKKNIFIELAEMGSLAVATYFFLIGRFEIGIIYLVLNLNSRMYWQIADLQNQFRSLPSDFLDIQKYFEAIEKVPSFTESGETEVPTGDIVISHLSFKYPHGERPVFDDISITIPQDKITAFVGISGSGKSSIVKLLLRAYDYSTGSISIGGKELHSIDAKALRRTIGYVEQHADLFDDTVRENILFGVEPNDRARAEADLEQIAQKTRISQFYHRLGEKKFDTLIGERGVKLSGGERQRLQIARAIIKNPSILIFDEATASLDTENERYIQEAIEEVSKGRTTIIIAHRLSTIIAADQIVVMNKGKVVATGNHQELLRNSTHYQDLVSNQVN